MSEMVNGDISKKDNKNSKIPGKDNNKNSTAGVIPEKKADKKHGSFFKLDHKYANICLYLYYIFWYNYIYADKQLVRYKEVYL